MTFVKRLGLVMLFAALVGCDPKRFVVSGDCHSWRYDSGKVKEKCFGSRHEAVDDYSAFLAAKENTKSWQERNWRIDRGGY